MPTTSSRSPRLPMPLTSWALPILCYLAAATSAGATRSITLHKDSSITLLGPHLELLEDTEGKLLLDDVLSGRWTPSPSPIPNLGFTSSVYWVRFSLQSSPSTPREYLLEVANPLLDRIDLHLKQPDGRTVTMTSGSSLPRGGRRLRNQNAIFSIVLPPARQTTIYLRFESRWSMQLPMRLWIPRTFFNQQIGAQMGSGLFYGLLMVMLLYYLFFFVAIKDPFTVKDRSYLFYVLFIASALLFQSTLSGLAPEHLWPAWPWLTPRALGFSICSLAFCGALLTTYICALKRQHPRWHKVFSFIALTAGAGAILALLLPHVQLLALGTLLVIITCALSIGLMFGEARRGVRPALFGFVAWAILFIGVTVLTLNKLGVIPLTFLTENLHQICLSLGVLLLSLSLADRINIIRKETEIAEKQLREAYSHLSEQDQIKSRLFSNVSHEVRTPLTLIMTPIARLLKAESGPLPEAVRQKLLIMAENAQRLLKLVNRLLDFSRLEAGGSMVFYERTDVCTLVESIVRAFDPYARSKGVRLKLRAAEKLPEVWVDAEKLDKVLCNLVSNALSSTDPGGTALVRTSLDGQWISITIIYQGTAIEAEPLLQISGDFYPMEEGFPTTEIDLALSKDLIGLTGGQFDIQSEEGVGNTITVKLPLGRKHIQDRSQIVEQPGTGQPTTRALAAARALSAEQAVVVHGASAVETVQDPSPLLLIVGDDASTRSLVAETCQKDFNIITASDGEKALDVIRQQTPALVISQTSMSVMNGLDLLNRIRSSPETASLPVILLTDNPMEEKRMEGLDRGADDYLVKPFEPRELLARARNMVRLQEQERHLRALNSKLMQDVVKQASLLERAMLLKHYLSPDNVRAIINEGQPVQVGQQRRRLTVFRLELRGFSEFIKQIEQEDMAAILNGYLMEMMDVAFLHGATVDKFIRDIILGFFGAPGSQGPKDDALCCTKMAADMWHRAHAISRRWREILYGEPPLPTLVLSSGYATVGNFGSSNRLEYTAVGGPVDEAAGLLTEVAAGEMACSQSTWSLIQGSIEGHLCKRVELSRPGHSVNVYTLHGSPTS